MKRIFTTLTLVISVTFVFGQTWIPDGAKFYYNFNQSPSVGYVKIEYIKDTVIASNTCKVLNKIRYTYDYPGAYHTVYLGNEYIFQSGDKIYNYKYGQFYLLYDFSPSIGDIWTMSASSRYQYTSCDTIGKIHVDSIGIKIIDSDSLKIIYTSPYLNSNWAYSGPIVEKLGCLGYMLPQQRLCDIDHGEGGDLRCYSDFLYSYQADSLIPCDFITGIDNNIFQNVSFNIYPVPTDKIIFIDINYHSDSDFKIELFSLQGDRILSNNFKGKDRIQIDISGIETGMYFIRLITNDGKIITKKILIN